MGIYLLGVLDPAVESVLKFVKKLANWALGMDIAGLSKYLTLTFDGGSEIWVAAKTVYDAVSLFGMGFAIIFLFIDIADKLSKERLSGYELLKTGISIILAFFLISKGFDVCNFFIETASEIGEEALKGLEDPSVDDEMIDALLKDLGVEDPGTGLSIMKAIGALIQLIIAIPLALILGLVGLAVNAFATAAMLSRAIQLCVYTAFAPLGIADLFGGGFGHSSGIKFFKKYFAVTLEGVVLILTLKMCGILQGSLLATGHAIQGALIVSFAKFSLIGKASQFTNDIVGA